MMHLLLGLLVLLLVLLGLLVLLLIMLRLLVLLRLLILLGLMILLILLRLLLLCWVPSKARLWRLRVVASSCCCMHAKLGPCCCLMPLHAVRGWIACRSNAVWPAHFGCGGSEACC